MAKLMDLSLEELYSRKITGKTEEAIIAKENFDSISQNWCDKACTLKCKNPTAHMIRSDKVDILIIQDHKATDDIRFNKSGDRIEWGLRKIVEGLMKRALIGTGDLGKISFAITDMVKCKIEREDLVKGKPPTQTKLQKCRPYLIAEIARRQPKVIISLATPVTKVLVEGKTNYDGRGDIVAYGDIPLVITIHPRVLTMLRQNSSGKFWGPDFYSVIERDFRKAIRLIKGEINVPDLDAAIEKAKKRIHIARSLEDVRTFASSLMTAGIKGHVLSYDLETTSLDPHLDTAKIITAQFGVRLPDGEVHSFVFPLWHRDNVWFNSDEAWPFIKPILESHEIRKIGHNIKFDILYTWFTTKTRVNNVLFDTMLLLHCINTGLQGMYGLKQAVVDWLPDLELGGYEGKLPKLSRIVERSHDMPAEGEEE